MRRVTLIIFAALLAATTAHAGWWKTYGEDKWDEGYCVQEINDGYIATGATLSYSPSGALLWLLKTDTNGNHIWHKTYGNPTTAGSVGRFIQKTIDGGYIITGQLGGEGKSEIWLLKINENGDTIWTKTFGETSGYCIQQTQDNGYIITGSRGWFTAAKLFLLKTNLDGDSLWMRTYLLEDWVFSLGYFVQQTEDHGYIVAGLIGDTTFENGREAFWLIKTDSVGDTMWTYIQGGDDWGDTDNARCVRQTNNGEYVALGTVGFLKLNIQGDTLWLKDCRSGSSLDVTSDSGYILSGQAGSILMTSLNNYMPQPLWLWKTNMQGDSTWKRTYEEGLSNYVKETSDKGFIVTGGTGDLFLLKTDSLGLLGIQENPIVEADNGWNVPHSIGSYIVLHYNDLPQGFRADVFDVSGCKVDEIRGDGNEGAMTWGINYPPGVYFIQAIDNQNQLKTAKVVLVR
jgi:hypothetical protein